MSMTNGSYAGRPASCPTWCVQQHGIRTGEDDAIHVSGELLVRGTSLRLCTTIDPATEQVDGPYVLLGGDEYTLHEADALIDALTHLVDEGVGVIRRAGA
ncbi:DUF6907 domain-containing protein [Humibacillus xanthopallidus]|uniref:DUF6907 domain-containing protein n=1 Tax=Humibacillus xanthopallidus TaxID=412689 RepID=UPI00384CF921